MFHFRLKSDKKPDGTKISATNTFNIFNAKAIFPISTLLTKIFLPAKLPPIIISIISIEQKAMSNVRVVFFTPTTYQNGLTTIQKNFFKRQTNMKVAVIAVIWKSSSRFPMNLIQLSNIGR